MVKTSKLKAALAIEDYDNQTFKLTIGGHKEIGDASFASGAGGFAPGSTISTPQGVVASPVTYNPVYGAYDSYSWSRSTYFSSLLNKNDLENVEGLAGSGLFDKIKQFESKLYIAPKSLTIFKHKGKFIYCYHDKRKNQLKFVKF